MGTWVPLLRDSSGIDLDGACVTHNHPPGSANEYSFSTLDISFFMDNDLKLLRGIDERFVYELSRNPTEIDDHVPWEEIKNSDGDMFHHSQMIIRALELGIGYRRWKR